MDDSMGLMSVSFGACLVVRSDDSWLKDHRFESGHKMDGKCYNFTPGFLLLLFEPIFELNNNKSFFRFFEGLI